MNTDAYTIIAVAASPTPVETFLAVAAVLLFVFTLIALFTGEEETALVLLVVCIFAGVVLFAVGNAPDQQDYDNRKNIAYSYNLEFTDPNQDIPDKQGTTAGYVLLNDTETVEYCVFERSITPDRGVDTLTVTCDGEPRPVREHLQER